MADLREAVVREARSWLGTPYLFCGREKNVGVDCHYFVFAVYEAAGLPMRVQIPVPAIKSWNDAALYMLDESPTAYPYRYMFEVASPEPGDVALFRLHKSYLHMAIVVEWPTVIHALRVVSLSDATQGILGRRKVKFLTPKVWC